MQTSTEIIREVFYGKRISKNHDFEEAVHKERGYECHKESGYVVYIT